jgi:tetratricopeptide (TPR) repeat protein
MNRIEAAIRERRCVLAIGKKAAANSQIVAELQRSQVPTVHLGGDPSDSIGTLDANNLAPALEKQGGVVVLVEPEPSNDGRALASIGDLVKQGANKPKIYIAAKAFNPFLLPIGLRTLKIEQLKFRAIDFLSALPVQAAPGEAGAAKSKKKSKREDAFLAPRPVFIGREEEVAQLEGLLDTPGGPIFVTGPDGVGKRWLVEHVLDKGERTRLPDLTLARGTGADALIARVASAANAAGDARLHDALGKRDGRPQPAELAQLIVESLNADAFENHTWVIHGLESLLDRRRGHFNRLGRLEMYLTAILSAQTKVRVLFVTPRLPAVYAQSATAEIQELRLEGLAGKVLHEVFEACHIEETPRDRFGPIVERTLGHPMAVRYIALTAKAEGDLEELLEQTRFLNLNAIDDQQSLRRHIKRRVEALDPETRKRLSHVALLRNAGSSELLRSLGLNRNQRLELLSLGLLEQTPVLDNRRYYVHPLIAHHLEYREVYDFGAMEALGQTLLELGHTALKDGNETLALSMHQEANRLLIEARRERSRAGMPYPDQDAMVDNILGLARRRSPRLDIARTRTNEAIKIDPYNPELLVAHAEIRAGEEATEEMVVGVFTHASDTCATPDVFHAEADYHFAKQSRGKAVAILERGIRAFPQDGRLRRRVATVYLDQNRIDEAVEMLSGALESEPGMPDTYGLLGDAHTRRGTAGWEQATQYLDEAIRLDGNSPRNLVRLAQLERDKSMIDGTTKEAGLERAEELLSKALEIDKGHPDAQAMKAAVILDRGGDIEQAEWLLKQIKRRDSSFTMVQKARVQIRRGMYDQVERILEKAIKKEKSNHAAFAAQAEFWEAQGQVFHAFESYRAAKERTPKSSPARIAYDQHLTRLGTLIESGHAAEMMKTIAPDAKAEASDTATEASAGPRRDAGSTTIRRKRKGKKAGPEAAEAAPEAEAAEAAPEAEAAEAAPEADAAVEVAADEAPIETAATEIPAGEAPADAQEEPATEATTADTDGDTSPTV